MAPPVMTPALLASLKNHPNLPRHSWYIIASSALTVLNRPEEIPKVYTYAVEATPQGAGQPITPEEQLSITRRIREALIKISMIGGMPKVFPIPRATSPEEPRLGCLLPGPT